MTWYQRRALYFRCTKCGDCCRRPGWVFLKPVEAERIAVKLLGDDGKASQLVGELWEEKGDEFIIEVTGNRGCPLLGPDGCRVHDVKPDQCRTYPFWPELLESEKAWDAERKYCEGIDPNGDTYRYGDITRMLRDERGTRGT